MRRASLRTSCSTWPPIWLPGQVTKVSRCLASASCWCMLVHNATFLMCCLQAARSGGLLLLRCHNAVPLLFLLLACPHSPLHPFDPVPPCAALPAVDMGAQAEALQQRIDHVLPVGSEPDEYDAWSTGRQAGQAGQQQEGELTGEPQHACSHQLPTADLAGPAVSLLGACQPACQGRRRCPAPLQCHPCLPLRRCSPLAHPCCASACLPAWAAGSGEDFEGQEWEEQPWEEAAEPDAELPEYAGQEVDGQAAPADAQEGEWQAGRQTSVPVGQHDIDGLLSERGRHGCWAQPVIAVYSRFHNHTSLLPAPGVHVQASGWQRAAVPAGQLAATTVPILSRPTRWQKRCCSSDHLTACVHRVLLLLLHFPGGIRLPPPHRAMRLEQPLVSRHSSPAPPFSNSSHPSRKNQATPCWPLAGMGQAGGR